MSDQSTLFLYHDLLNLPHETSIATVGKINKKELQALHSINHNFNTIGWPSRIEEKDIEIAKQYSFENEPCVENEDFVMFASIMHDNGRSIFETVISNHFDLSEHFDKHHVDFSGFSSYFAHIHDDENVADWRAQLNFILDNEAKHSILSIDVNGNHHLVTPKSGEIIFLDVHCKHAIIPNQKLGFEVMRKNPMVSLFVS